MVEHTLRDLLNENETQTVAKIVSGTPKEQKLCLGIARIKKFASVVPVLDELVKKERNREILQATFLTMGELGDRHFLDIFRGHLTDNDEIIAAICIEMVGVFRDEESLPQLQTIIDNAEKIRLYKECKLETSKAILAIRAIGNETAISYLVSKLHHKNPTARRIIHDMLVEFGEVVIPWLDKIFQTEDTSMLIMATNVLGRIGSRNAGNSIVTALELENTRHPNVRFAIYEALGFIVSSKGLIALLDGLAESDGLTLRAVLTSLELQFNPHAGKRIAEVIAEDDPQGQNIIHTIISVKALNIFTYLYNTDKTTARKLLAVLQLSKDNDILSAFVKRLEAIGSESTVEDVKKLTLLLNTKSKGPRVLAVDDSISMLSYYRSVCTNMALEIVTAENGKEAWYKMENGHANFFNLIIVDMNMPVMDGIELTKKIRASSIWNKIPIIMATTESDKSQVRLAKQSGVDEFIIKPMTPVVLEKKIKKMLELKEEVKEKDLPINA